ncbi:A24 family peptidase [Burkholderia sp. BCC0322]|uniref:A24 family peptidase n=1 Tax=unclassified Burkholderia TaxID=2613784 RepID=UPI001589E5FC|nr:prepilin peptidase [Burkholderia sp. BCC0322]
MFTFVQSVATVLLASLAAQDLRDRRLSNRVVLAFAALYFVAAALARDGFAPLAGHVATGAGMLLLCGGMRHAGWIGGGDVKLAAVFLWAGPAWAFPVLTGVGACGAVCGLALLASRRRHAAQVRAVAARGVPYGVALALGGTLAVWASFPHTVSLI